MSCSKMLCFFAFHRIRDVLCNILCSELVLVRLCSAEIEDQGISLRNNMDRISYQNGRVDSNLFELITKSRIFGVSLLNRYFLRNVDVLYSEMADNDFKEMWMRTLCGSNILLEMKSDPKYNELYTSIKENLKNVLAVLIQKRILRVDIEDGLDGDVLSETTWNKINEMFPRMKGELREQNVSQQQDQGQFDRKEYPHPTPTPYSRMEEKLDIDEKYIRRASSTASLRSKNGIDVSSVGSVGSDEIVLVD